MCGKASRRRKTSGPQLRMRPRLTTKRSQTAVMWVYGTLYTMTHLGVFRVLVKVWVTTGLADMVANAQDLEILNVRCR